ncbi:MAG: hypothetical protein HC812_07775 [Leptolyngbya sp. RL_3_1]|nr:hypothetical protein [Leptolyngbya sp. RL_3_1]
MTPNAIRTLAQVRQDFYAAFAESIGFPVTTTKGGSHSSNASKIAWADGQQRANYICVYAHLAPDVLIPERPLILRLGVNKGLGLEPAKRKKESPQSGQKLLRFEVTFLPDEILGLVPWIVSLLHSQDLKPDVAVTPPSYLAEVKELDELIAQGAWTVKATECFAEQQAAAAAAAAEQG